METFQNPDRNPVHLRAFDPIHRHVEFRFPATSVHPDHLKDLGSSLNKGTVLLPIKNRTAPF